MEFKKRNITLIKAKQFEIGMTVVGKFEKIKDREITDRETGEMKTIKDVIFMAVDNTMKPFNIAQGDKFGIVQDAGLKVMLSSSDVIEGDIVKITKLEKTENSRGQQLNQYEVLVAE